MRQHEHMLPHEHGSFAPNYLLCLIFSLFPYEDQSIKIFEKLLVEGE